MLLSVPDNEHEQKAKEDVMNVGEDVVEIRDLEGRAMYWVCTEEIVVAEVLISSGYKFVVLAVYGGANFDIFCVLSYPLSQQYQLPSCIFDSRLTDLQNASIVCFSLYPCRQSVPQAQRRRGQLL